MPTPEFLAALRELTQQHGALLICDEVMTGFRVAYGGAQSLLGIEPDLTTLGKIVGGGLPVGAYGGRAEIMEHVLPAGKVFQAGTLSGNPLATAAGIATLQAAARRAALRAAGSSSAPGWQTACAAAANEAGVPHTLARVGSMLTLFFNPAARRLGRRQPERHGAASPSISEQLVVLCAYFTGSVVLLHRRRTVKIVRGRLIE